MAHQPSTAAAAAPISRPTLVDLICVVGLAVLLWGVAEGVGSVARASNLHPAPGSAADCGHAPATTVAQASPLAPAVGECGDAAQAPAPRSAGH